MDPWRQQMKELAACPNVVCKISGVATEADHKNWTREQLRPYIAHAIDAFGFDRSLYGGDWHVLELAGTYPDWVDIVDWVTAGASAGRAAQALPRQHHPGLSARLMRAEALKRKAYSIAAVRALARARLPRPVFDFADGGAEDEITLAPERGGVRRDRAPAAPAERRGQPRPLGHAFRQAPGAAGDRRPDRSRRAVPARRRMRDRARGGQRGHRLLPQPRLGLHARGARRDRRRAALDAGLHLPRPRLHPRTRRARPRPRTTTRWS